MIRKRFHKTANNRTNNRMHKATETNNCRLQTANLFIYSLVCGEMVLTFVGHPSLKSLCFNMRPTKSTGKQAVPKGTEGESQKGPDQPTSQPATQQTNQPATQATSHPTVIQPTDQPANQRTSIQKHPVACLARKQRQEAMAAAVESWPAKRKVSTSSVKQGRFWGKHDACRFTCPGQQDHPP